MERAVKTQCRKAGPAHAVVNMWTRNDEPHRRSPCAGCPFRVDQTGQFPAQAFLHSVGTSYDGVKEVFGCHMSGLERPSVCAGFIIAHHASNGTLRARIANGALDLATVTSDDLALYRSYTEMAIANGVPANHPLLAHYKTLGS